MLPVAFATENNSLDGRILAELVRMVRGFEVQLWPDASVRFRGWRPVVRGVGTLLRLADEAGVRHAIVAIDNDGGASRRPEHAEHHQPDEEAKSLEDGCAECILASQLPPSWRGVGRACVVVPVQTIETWLLVAAGRALGNPIPERNYHRRVLKAVFWGDDLHAEDAHRLRIAVDALRRPGALAALRERPSFQRFESQLATWSAQ